MADIRGEKVSFSKRDIVPLHALPSANAEDPLIVHCPAARTVSRRLLSVVSIVVVLLVMAFAAITIAVETGSLDGALSAQARTLLGRQIGQRYDTSIGSTAIRFASGFKLALEARDVDIIDRESGKHLTKTGSIRMVLDPLSLLAGRLSVAMVEASGVDIDTALFPQSAPMDFSNVRIDALPKGLETVFSRLDLFLATVTNGDTGRVAISDISIHVPRKDEAPFLFEIEQLELLHGEDGKAVLGGEIAFNGQVAAVSLMLESDGKTVKAFEAGIDGLDLFPLLVRRDPAGALADGLDVNAGLKIRATRATEAVPPSLSAILGTGAGTLYIGGGDQQVTAATIQASYNPSNHAIEIAHSNMQFGQTSIPFSAKFTDSADAAAPGFDIDLHIANGQASAENSGEAPVAFEARGAGRYLASEKQLDFPALHVTSPAGTMAGSLKMRFGKGSPEISFGGQIPKMESAGVKQLWPFWMARKARVWAVSNIFGGTVTNGSIAVFLPAGRMLGPGHPLELDENELRISFDIDGTRLNVAGDIPPLRDAAAHVELKGPMLDVSLKKAASYFGSGRQVDVEKGNLSIASTYAKPLMADMNILVSGASDALAELVTFNPLNALKDSGFAPTDFSGPMKADVKARFGLIASQGAPQPVWNADMTLSGVSLTRPLAGRKITDVNGSVAADNDTIKLDAKAKVNDVPMDISLVEPARKDSKTARTRTMKANLDGDQLGKFAPGLRGVIDGPVSLDISSLDQTRSKIVADLSRAVLTVPVIGWTKGAGVAASARFEMVEDGDRTRIDSLELRGDGFGAQGSLVVGSKGLVSANMDQVRLSQGDNYAVGIKTSKAGYDVSISGASADLRPLIVRLRGKSAGTAKSDGDVPDVNLDARFDRVAGFNGENLSNVTSSVTVRSGRLRSVAFSGVAESGQALVAKTTASGGKDVITLTSGDAGAFARFIDVYSRIRGGLLNASFGSNDGSAWAGSVDMRNFALANEQKLQSIVDTPAGDDGRSLNRAVRREIDVSSERFQRGFASVLYRDGTISVENGVVRGEQIGATFQGIVRDRSGNMDMTGTFMPAYGLNRLFAELPLIGVILGNGRDRGLLGITFKMTGRSDAPKFTVNPLSLIAPGVFRQIFEFQ